jgi:hypothetical protein
MSRRSVEPPFKQAAKRTVGVVLALALSLGAVVGLPSIAHAASLGAIHGHVSLTGPGTVPDVFLVALQVDVEGVWRDAGGNGASVDETGYYEFTDLEPNQYRVVFGANTTDYTQSVVASSVPSGQTVTVDGTITTQTTQKVSGTITGAEDEIDVDIYRRVGEGDWILTTTVAAYEPGSSKAYSVKLGTGQYRFRFYDGERKYDTQYWDHYEFEGDVNDADNATSAVVDGKAVPSIDARMTLAPTISGIVTDSSDKPVADVYVMLLTWGDPDDPDDHGDWNYSDDAVTDANGRFVVNHLTEGRYYTLRFDVEDARTLGRFSYLNGLDHPPASTADSSATYFSGTSQTIDFKLPDGAIVDGKVVDDSGAGVADATLRFYLWDGANWNLVRTMTTSASGTYRVGLQTQTGQFTIAAAKDGYATTFYRNAPGLPEGEEGPGTFSYDEESLSLDTIVTPVVIVGSLTPGTPNVSGSPTVGSVLTASPGTWSPEPDSYSYQWLRNSAEIAGATRSTYTVDAGDQPSTLSVRVTGKKFGYTGAVATSGGFDIPAAQTNGPTDSSSPGPSDTGGSQDTAPPALKHFKAVTPKIAGTVRVGKTLLVKIVSWKPKPKYTYQWYANGKKIKKATHSTLKLVKSLKGKKIRVKVTGTKTEYQTAIKLTKATIKVKAKSAR